MAFIKLISNNKPEEAGFIEQAYNWKYGSAKNNAGKLGQIYVEILSLLTASQSTDPDRYRE